MKNSAGEQAGAVRGAWGDEVNGVSSTHFPGAPHPQGRSAGLHPEWLSRKVGVRAEGYVRE